MSFSLRSSIKLLIPILLNFLINTSDDNNEFLIGTSNPHFLNNDIDLNYGLKYSQKDYSEYQSYKLNEYSINTLIFEH